MKIETKYNIGDKIWIVYEGTEGVNVYIDEISNIIINEKGNIVYCTQIGDYEEYKEEDIISYKDKLQLIEKIHELAKKIAKEDGLFCRYCDMPLTNDEEKENKACSECMKKANFDT